MRDKLRREFPEVTFRFTVCCGDNPAIAHDALRAGFTSIICATTPAMLEKLRSVAADFSPEVLDGYPDITGNRTEGDER